MSFSHVIPVCCRSEPVHHCDGDRADPEEADDDHVDQLGHELAVEAVVEPGHKAANSKEADTDVVKLVEQLGDRLAVAADRVEEGGHAEAEDRAHEEEQEDQLLPELDVSVALTNESTVLVSVSQSGDSIYLVAQRLHVEYDRDCDENYEAWRNTL